MLKRGRILVFAAYVTAMGIAVSAMAFLLHRTAVLIVAIYRIRDLFS